MEVGAVEDGSRLIRTDKAVVFRDIVGVEGPGGAARARCTCAVEVGVPVRVDATETGRDGQGRGVGVGVEEWGGGEGRTGGDMRNNVVLLVVRVPVVDEGGRPRLGAEVLGRGQVGRLLPFLLSHHLR